jgi:rhodanese-related sulfurtransferase
MNRLIASLLLPFFSSLLAIQAVSCQQPESGGAIKHVDVSSFQKMTRRSDVILLDVRTPQEFAEGHLSGARNLDFSSEGFAAALTGMDKSVAYMVYCKSGRRSAMAAEQMQEAGFTTITDLKGGITAWQSARLPVVRD